MAIKSLKSLKNRINDSKKLEQQIIDDANTITGKSTELLTDPNQEITFYNMTKLATNEEGKFVAKDTNFAVDNLKTFIDSQSLIDPSDNEEVALKFLETLSILPLERDDRYYHDFKENGLSSLNFEEVEEESGFNTNLISSLSGSLAENQAELKQKTVKTSFQDLALTIQNVAVPKANDDGITGKTATTNKSLKFSKDKNVASDLLNTANKILKKRG